ncbi:unnamed protein product [Acanthoscelides obtectus]|uniref:Uncharacterized protein n=1 Tax=Acanthoscelides obtectus TaxID=200917 RepID=A0A9P0JV73_ACAOB|nr:unnamed protein product [Acanthoscelides obtectus]CAK1628040.1 hypothetical protein AOBTE_LOCUS4975 [Acanthoscelides obtectus]
MKIRIVFCIMCIWIFKIKRVTTRDLDVHSKLDKYLNDQRDDMNSVFQKHPVRKRGANDIERGATKVIPIDITIKDSAILLFSLKGDVYVIKYQELFKIDNKTFSLDPVGRFSRLENNEYVSYAKVAQNEGDQFLFVRTQTGNTHIYRITDKDIVFLHSIYLPHFKNCKFFTQDENLYLAVISNERDNLGDLVIYMWIGTHFDEISTKNIRSAVEISTFRISKSTEILITLHKSPEVTYIQIYEFYNSNLRKLQYVPVNENSTHLEVFKKDNRQHLSIYETSGNHSVYFWEVSHIRKSFKFTTAANSTHGKILRVDNRSIMINPQLNKLEVYYVKPGKLNPIPVSTYITTFLDIHSIHNRENNGNITSFVVGKSIDNSVVIQVVSFKINSDGTDSETEEVDVIRKCFNSLEGRAYSMKLKLAETELVGIKPSHEVDELVSQSLTAEADIDTLILNIKETLKKQQDRISKYNSSDGNNLIINGNVTFAGSVTTNKLKAKKLDFQRVNGQKWVPQEWLKYKEPQTITGPVKIENITATNLYTSENDGLFKDMLLKDGDQVISAAVKLKSLKANNGISTDADDKDIIENNNQILQKFVEPLSIPDGNVEIENLFVEEINGVNWNEFINSVFVVGNTTHIDGPLFISKLKTGNLTVKTLNGIPVDKFLTTSTDQVIKSNISFDTIFVKNINVNITNGIRLSTDAVTFEDTVIGPITIDELNVLDTLKVASKLNESLFNNIDGDTLEPKEKGLQHYTGKVKIKGNLYLKNLKTLPRTKILVSDHEINPDISKVYWTKSTRQEIPVNVTFRKGLTIPHLLTENLNGIQFDRYLTTSSDPKYETTYVFDNVVVLGNVKLSNLDADHRPNLTKIDQEAVKTSGVFSIRGRKKYPKSLTVKNLVAENIGGIDTSNALHSKMSNVTIKGKKRFETLTVTGNLTLEKENKVDRINGVKLKEFSEDIIYIDRPENITMLNFNKIKAENLHVTMLNEKPIEHHQKTLDNIMEKGEINKLIIGSNSTLDTLQNVSTINGITFQDLERSMMKIGEHKLKGDIKFRGKVRVNNLITAFVNDINLKQLMPRILCKKGNQTITAPWSFNTIKTKNLETPSINDYDVENLIDVSSEQPQLMFSPGSTEFTDLVTAKAIEAPNLKPCSLDDIVEYINNPPTQEWQHIHVRGNVTILDPDSLINRILTKTAKKDQINVIQAMVTFASGIVAKNINTSIDINNVNLTDIINDARISGQKWFKSVKASCAVVLKNADIPLVNGEDIRKLNEDIVNKENVTDGKIRGRKTFFGGLKTENLNVKVLGDVQPKDIVLVDAKEPIPSAIFEYVEIESNLDVGNINNISLQKVLDNRIVLNDPRPQRTDAVVYFDDLIIEMTVDDVVFDVGEQTVMGKKNFVKDVEVFGNVTTDLINGLNISQAYQNSVMSNKNIIVNGSITQAINSCPVGLIKDVIRKQTPELAARDIQEIKNKIVENIETTLPIAQVHVFGNIQKPSNSRAKQ